MPSFEIFAYIAPRHKSGELKMAEMDEILDAGKIVAMELLRDWGEMVQRQLEGLWVNASTLSTAYAHQYGGELTKPQWTNSHSSSDERTLL